MSNQTVVRVLAGSVLSLAVCAGVALAAATEIKGAAILDRCRLLRLRALATRECRDDGHCNNPFAHVFLLGDGRCGRSVSAAGDPTRAHAHRRLAK